MIGPLSKDKPQDSRGQQGLGAHAEPLGWQFDAQWDSPVSALAVKYRQANSERASDNQDLGKRMRRGLCWIVATPDVLLFASALTPFFFSGD